FYEALALKLLDTPNEDVRTWAIRLVGDDNKCSRAFRDALVLLAKMGPSARVRSQMGCTCKRLPAEDCLAVVSVLLRWEDDADDPHIPLLLWWAMESKAISHPPSTLLVLGDDREVWRAPIVQRTIIERLARRYMAAGGDWGIHGPLVMLNLAPREEDKLKVIAGMEQALQGKGLPKVPDALAYSLAELRKKHPDHLTLLRLMLRPNDDAAHKQALA